MAPPPPDAPGSTDADAGTTEATLSPARRLGGDVSVRVAARIAAAALQAATLLLLARALGPTDFGSFAVFSSIGMLLSAVASLGASTRVLRLRAEPAADTLLPALFWLQVAGAVLVLVGIVAAGLVTGSPGPAAVGGLLAFSDQQMDFRVAYLSGQARQTAASFSILTQRGLALVAVGGAIFFGLPVLVPAGVAFVVVAVIALAPAPAHRVAVRTLVSSGRSSVGYWFAALVGNLRQLESPVVGATGGVGAAGLYAIAARVSNPLTIVVTSLQAIAIPEMARSTSRAEFRRTFRLLLGVAAVYAVALVAGSPLVAEIFLRVVGAQYEGARTLVTVLVICAGISAVSQALQARLLAVGRPSTPAWIIGAATVIGLVLLAVTSSVDGGAELWVAPLASQLFILIALALVPVRGPGPAPTTDAETGDPARSVP